LLKYDGISWNQVTKGGIITDSLTLYGGFESVWGNSPDKLYLTGALCYEGVPGNWKLSAIPYNSPGENFNGLSSLNFVYGDASNNVFICGDRELIIHWNGKNWHIYNEFFDKSKQTGLRCIWLKNNRVFIVGYTSSQALIYRGIQ
jgi:hypothetical protein